MLSSERVLGSRAFAFGASEGSGDAAATRLLGHALDGAVLRNSRRQGGMANRPVFGVGVGPNGGRIESQAGEPPSAESIELRRLHDAAEQRGYDAGLARAEQELGDAVGAAGAVAARLAADAPSERAVLARWVTDLSLAIARRILGDAIRSDATVLLSVVERAVSAADASPDVRVLVHPRAVAPVREAWEAAHGSAYLGKRWTFGADPTLPPTGCLVRYQHGLVDAGIDTQLAAVDAALKAAIEAAERAADPEAPG